MSPLVLVTILAASSVADAPEYERLELQIFDAVNQWGGVVRRPPWVGSAVGMSTRPGSNARDESALAIARFAFAPTPEVGLGVSLPLTTTTRLGGGGLGNLGFDADYILIDRARYRLGLRGEVWIPTGGAQSRAAFAFLSELPAVAPHTTTLGFGADTAWAPFGWLLLTGHVALHGHHVGGPTGGAGFASLATGASVATPLFLGGDAAGHRFFITPGCEFDAFSALDTAGSALQVRVTPGVSLGFGHKAARVTREGGQSFLASFGYQLPVANAGATGLDTVGRFFILMRLQFATARAKYEARP